MGSELTYAPMLSLLLGLMLFVYGTLLPGIALAWIMLSDRDPLVLGVLGLTIGILALPLVHFSIAIVLGTHIHALGIVATSSVILALSYGVHRRQEPSGV